MHLPQSHAPNVMGWQPINGHRINEPRLVAHQNRNGLGIASHFYPLCCGLQARTGCCGPNDRVGCGPNGRGGCGPNGRGGCGPNGRGGCGPSGWLGNRPQTIEWPDSKCHCKMGDDTQPGVPTHGAHERAVPQRLRSLSLLEADLQRSEKSDAPHRQSPKLTLAPGHIPPHAALPVCRHCACVHTCVHACMRAVCMRACILA